MKRGSGPEHVLLPLGDDEFYFAHDEMTTVSFIRNESGAITAHLLRQAFDRDTAWVVTAAPAGGD